MMLIHKTMPVHNNTKNNLDIQTSPLSPSGITYRPDIDGLRAIAVLCVLIFHAFPKYLKGGFIGVDIFFVISGYLISGIILSDLDREKFSFRQFYIRRIRRIFPVLTVVLFSCLAFGWFALTADELNQLGKHVAAGAGFISNLVLWNEAGYFDNSAETKPLLHLWSLGIEEQFYLVWPLLLWASWKKRLNIFIVCLILTIISFGWNIGWYKTNSVADYFSPQTRFWELIAGAMLAYTNIHWKDRLTNVRTKLNGIIFRTGTANSEKTPDSALPNHILSAAGAILLAVSIVVTRPERFPGTAALLPVIATVMLIAAGNNGWFNKKILSRKGLVWLGLISYPLYLWHWPLFSFARILCDRTPTYLIRVILLLASILLAWLTVKVIEKPFRFGNRYIRLKVIILCTALFITGILGLAVSQINLNKSHTFDKLLIHRKNFEHGIGSSMAWYRGKNDWLFLGNAYNDTVAKLKLAITPDRKTIRSTMAQFSKLAGTAAESNIPVVLIMGPNKSSIYPEYLPDELVPSSQKYSSFFLEELRKIPNLTVYDPTADLLEHKQSEGLLYWMTDTHWNPKGAFLTYTGFAKLFGLPVPDISFRQGMPRKGDLIGISKQKDFPMHAEDNWEIVWKNKPVLVEENISDTVNEIFGPLVSVTNKHPLSDKHIWIIGDSFNHALRPYFNAVFSETRYIGHWSEKLNHLPSELKKAARKPDMIIVIRVERSF